MRQILRVLSTWRSLKRLLFGRTRLSDELRWLREEDQFIKDQILNKEWQEQLKEIELYNMTTKEQFYNKPLNKIFPMRKKEGLIGLEIECEGTSLFKNTFNYWSCHTDGSLRAVKGHEPIEYVLTEPVSREVLKKALEYLEAKLKAAGSSVIDSTRTSVHVHINVQDYTVRQLYNFICLYLIFEEILVEWCGPTRIGNCFTLRGKDSDFWISMLEAVLKDNSFKSWNENVRYAACNVASVTKFGSLEFRSLRGTVNIEVIQTWVDLLLNIKTQAEKYDNPIEIVNDFIALGPLPFFRKIFNNDRQRAMLERFDGLSGKLWDGLRLMRDIAHVVEWLPPIKKKPGEQKEKDPSKWIESYGRAVQIGSIKGIIDTYINTNDNNVNINVHDYDEESDEIGPRYVLPLWPGQRIYFVPNGPVWVKLALIPSNE